MSHSINWINNAEKNLEEIGQKALDNVLENVNNLLNPNECNVGELLELELSDSLIEEIKEEIKDNSLSEDDDFDMLSSCLQGRIREYQAERFNEYGLCFDYVELDGNNDQDYFRYQICYGGPTEEIRFYDNGAIEYVYMDWFCGIGFNVNTDSTFKSLRDYFTDLGMLDFEE